MVNEAEKYKDDDETQRLRIQAKNSLESYAFTMKSTVEDEKLKDKISDEDKTTIVTKCKDVLEWLDHNQVCTVHNICLNNSCGAMCPIAHLIGKNTAVFKFLMGL